MTRGIPLAATLLSLVLPAALMAQSDSEALAHARRLLEQHPLIDGHNDLPWEIRTQREHPMDVEAYDLRKTTPGHTDLARLREGRVGAQFWSIYVPGEIRDSGFARVQLEQFDIARRTIARYPELLVPAYSADDIERAFREKKIGSLLGMEGGHVIENSLGALRMYYEMGARYLTLTHNVTLDWADAAADSAKHGGLTDFGREVVREMNRLGMLVDLSHVSPGTMSDALDVTRAPVIFSHSSARALTDHVRNVPDSILKRLPANGGVVMVTFVPGFISTEIMEYEKKAGEFRATLRSIADTTERRARWNEWRESHPRPVATIDDVADHIEHVRDVASIDNVGIGSDFDGISETPVGLEDVSKFPALFAELIQRGWSDEDLIKLAGGNLLRAFRVAESVAGK